MKYFPTPLFILIFAGSAFITEIVSAQKYLPGYVLLNNGDTLQGYVQTETWSKAPERVRFKSADGEEHLYSPLLIHSFRIRGGDWYFSFVGDIDPSSLFNDNLTYDPTPDTMRVAFFIRAIVIGKVSLYYARDQNDRIHLFLQKDGGAIRELNYKKYYGDEKVIANYRLAVTRRIIYANQIYKRQLMEAFEDCKSVTMHLWERPMSYSKNDIMKQVIEYNQCMNSKMEYKEEKEAWKFEVSVLGGINYASVKVTGPETDEESTFLEPSLGYAAGLALNIIISRTQERWAIYNELFVRDFKSQGTSEYGLNIGTRDIEMDFVYVKLASMMRYQSSKGVIKPFVNFGFTNGLAIKDVSFATSANGETKEFMQPVRKYEQGLIFGTGVRWKNLSADARVEFSNGMSGYPSIKTAFTTVYGLVGYTF